MMTKAERKTMKTVIFNFKKLRYKNLLSYIKKKNIIEIQLCNITKYIYRKCNILDHITNKNHSVALDLIINK